MKNPYVLIATHQRLSVTKRNIDCLLKCNVGIILVVSDDAEHKLFRQLYPMIVLVRHGNYPLGKKWQEGVNVARNLNADPLIVNGSDDILHPDFFNQSERLLEEEFEFIGLRSWYMYDMKNVHRFNYMAPLPLGGGRVYSKSLLDRIDYKIFDIKRDRLLDDLGWHNAYKSRHVLLHEPLILSVKGDWPVMNPVDKMMNHPNAQLVQSYFDPKPILEKFNYES